MRQLEAAWYDGARIERSKVRIRRLGYFEDVNIETPPVAGIPDQADVEVTVTEKATGNLLAGRRLLELRESSCSTRRSRSRTSSAAATR